jgi:hypothetical protein
LIFSGNSAKCDVMLSFVNERRSVRRGAHILLNFIGVGVLLITPCLLHGVEISPASARDIKFALGPDAGGLALSQDHLPDLFALTASRIEEDPRKFKVEEPYLSGRWKGGKAVIEYARDLSYTLVSVYDKDGHRQRIYSVSSRFNEHVAPEIEESETVVDVDNAETQSPPPRPSPSSVSGEATKKSVSSSKREIKVNYEWDDAKGAYVPVESNEGAVVVEETPKTQEVQPSAQATSETRSTSSSHTSKRRRHHHHQSEMEVASAQGTPAQNALPAPMAESGVWLPPANSTRDQTKSVKSQERATKVKAGDATWVEKPSESNSAATNTKTNDEWVPKSIGESQSSANSAVSSSSPQEAPPPPRRRHRTHHKTSVTASPATPEAAPETAPAPSSPATPVEAPIPQPSSQVNESAVPSTEELIAGSGSKTGPDTSSSDKWVPKATPKPSPQELAAEEAPPPPTQVAMIPKAKPVDNSVDNLLRMAEQGKGEMPHDSDKWVPQKAAATNTETELNKEIARVREQERQQQQAAAKPKVVLKHDINNPEEGVLPVSSFEKFSGPLYGRHREYERRFYPGKYVKSKIPHDFYVDEVDRKKEIHNVYLYQHLKGKAPKLVAVERHDKVSFMGNYDIEKEDKGKITEYN